MADNLQVSELINEQLANWPQAAENYAALRDVKVKDFDVDGMRFKVQFNPPAQYHPERKSTPPLSRLANVSYVLKTARQCRTVLIGTATSQFS